MWEISPWVDDKLVHCLAFRSYDGQQQFRYVVDARKVTEEQLQDIVDRMAVPKH